MPRRSVWLVAFAALCVSAPAWNQNNAWAQNKIDNILTGRPLSSGSQSQQATGAAETPESVISVQAKFTAPGAGRPAMLWVTAKIKPGWHIYSLSQKPIKAEPTTITVDRGSDYRLVGDFRPNLPPHEIGRAHV